MIRRLTQVRIQAVGSADGFLGVLRMHRMQQLDGADSDGQKVLPLRDGLTARQAIGESPIRKTGLSPIHRNGGLSYDYCCFLKAQFTRCQKSKYTCSSWVQEAERIAAPGDRCSYRRDMTTSGFSRLVYLMRRHNISPARDESPPFESEYEG